MISTPYIPISARSKWKRYVSSNLVESVIKSLCSVVYVVSKGETIGSKSAAFRSSPFYQDALLKKDKSTPESMGVLYG